MFYEQAEFSLQVTGSDYVLVWRGEQPRGPSWHSFEPVDQRLAAYIVTRAAADHERGPKWPLLRLLGIEEHPYNLHPADLQSLVLRGLARLELYRTIRPLMEVRAGARIAPPHVPAPLPAIKKPIHYVIVEALSQAGGPVRGVRLEITVPDGSVRTLVTDPAGRASVDGIDAGSCRIVLPAIDLRAWTAGGSASQLAWTEPGPTHVVVQGESLSRIAHKYGVDDWQTIWNDGKNAALKSMRQSPHVLLPGDRVVLPEREVGQIERSTDATHQITVKLPEEKLVTVRLRLEARWKKALEGLEYKVTFSHDGKLVTRPGAAPTNGAGLIEEKIPVQVASVVLAFERPKIFFKLLVGVLDPLEDGQGGALVDTGVSARLRALGYASSLVGDQKTAVASFQQTELAQAEPTGELDAQTRDKVEQLYGA